MNHQPPTEIPTCQNCKTETDPVDESANRFEEKMRFLIQYELASSPVIWIWCFLLFNMPQIVINLMSKFYGDKVIRKYRRYKKYLERTQ